VLKVDGLSKDKTLRANEENLRQMIDNIPGLVFTATAEGEIEFVNKQVLEYTGRKYDELKGWQVTDLVYPDDLPKVIEELQRSLETGQSRNVEHRVRGGDGTYRWFEVRRLPERNDEEQIVRWYLLLTDIHERKRAEDALRANEHNLRVMIDTLPGLISTHDAAGEIESVNRPLADFFGKAAEHIKDGASFIHPDDRQNLIALWRHSVETGAPFEAVARLLGAQGQRWFSTRGLPLRDTEGRILRWYVLLTDIEDQKRAEEALRADIEVRRQVEDQLRENQTHLLEMQALTRSGSGRLNLKRINFYASVSSLAIWQ
jgi:PAS domain S-box-containing protein